MEKVLKGLPVAKRVYQRMKQELQLHEQKPSLGIIQVGNDPAATYYVKSLQKKGQKHRITIHLFPFSENVTQKEIEAQIETLNNQNDIHAIMLQKPLPKSFDENKLHAMIHPAKDVDGFHPLNLGNLLLDGTGFVPCTPAAVLEMIDFYEIETAGKHIVIIGRSNIVGKPLANLLIRKTKNGNATVTICHSRTKNIADLTRQADILIPALGQANFVNEKMIGENVILLDVGVNQIIDSDGSQKYVGDADYNSCYRRSLAITPVPGGIGTVTTAMLLQNVHYAYKKFKEKNI